MESEGHMPGPALGAIVSVILGVTCLAACDSDLSPGASPSPIETPGSTSVPGVPGADVEFRPLIETYSSVWDALELEETFVAADMWQVPLSDGSVLSTEVRDEGGARILRVSPSGEESPLTDWLQTDRGQAWSAVAYSDPWLVYADSAGSHSDGPIAEPGVILANTENGETTVLEVRDYTAPREVCEECGDWLFFTEAAIGDDAVYWTQGGPADFIYDRPVRSQSFDGGQTVDLFMGNVHFDDASCVTTPGAEVRVSGTLQVYGEDYEHGVDVWDLGPAGATLVSPPEGLQGSENNVTASTCAGTDVAAWMTRLDGEPWDGSIAKWSENDPEILLNAIDFVGPQGRARVRFDDDSALFQVTSSIDGWAVIQFQAVDSVDDRFLLFDTDEWNIYVIDAPEGAVLTRAAVSGGRLLVYIDTDLSQDWYSGDTLISAVLP